MKKQILTTMALLSLSHSIPCFSQERITNVDAATTLRTWPASGNWLIALNRNEQHEFFCVLFTGHRNQASEELYLWGLRHLGASWSAVIADRNASALSGEQLNIVIDGSGVGSFPLTNRTSKNGMEIIRADLPDKQSKRIVRLMALGETMKFVTANSTYSVRLDGIAHALVYLSACDAEAQTFENPQ